AKRGRSASGTSPAASATARSSWALFQSPSAVASRAWPRRSAPLSLILEVSRVDPFGNVKGYHGERDPHACICMKKAKINGLELEYEVKGSGEPLLLISSVLADGFVPLLAQRELADHYRIIVYHKRGWVGSTRTPGPVTVAEHGADAAALLDHLDIPR